MKKFDAKSSSWLWNQMIERKESSRDPVDRSSLFVGMDMESGAPVFIPWEILQDGHAHISGRTGCGKTASALMSMAFQILRIADLSEKEEDRGPLVIIDLKGDLALFNAVRQAAGDHNRKFRFFTVHKEQDYYFFDPFQIFRLGCVTPMELASEFVRAFSLDYGLIYGGLYYTHQNLAILIDAVKEMMRRHPGKPTIGALSQILSGLGRDKRSKDAEHIQSCFKFLAECEQVNIEAQPTEPENKIDMLQVLEDCDVVYFYLQLQGQAPSLRQIASLALYTLSHAARERQWLGLPQRNTFVLIDEFHHIAGKSFGEFLSTVRGEGLHLVLANQNRDQLETHDPALATIVEANTVVQQAFTLTIDETKRMIEESGEIKEFLAGFSEQRLTSYLKSVREAWTTRLTSDDIQQVSDTRLASLLLVQDGTYRPGARVRKVQSLYPIPKVLYDYYREAKLPKRVLPNPPEPKSSSTPPPAAPPRPSAQAAELHTRMETLWQELVREETPAGR